MKLKLCELSLYSSSSALYSWAPYISSVDTSAWATKNLKVSSQQKLECVCVCLVCAVTFCKPRSPLVTAEGSKCSSVPDSPRAHTPDIMHSSSILYLCSFLPAFSGAAFNFSLWIGHNYTVSCFLVFIWLETMKMKNSAVNVDDEFVTCSCSLVTQCIPALMFMKGFMQIIAPFMF